jgi:hypothetical protein
MGFSPTTLALRLKPKCERGKMYLLYPRTKAPVKLERYKQQHTALANQLHFLIV